MSPHAAMSAKRLLRASAKKPVRDLPAVERLGELSQSIQTPAYSWALLANHAHILLRSGPQGLAAFVRKLLTGYAIGYNRRHRRHGHLFQNRCPS
jgi:hypothetical protein